MGRVNGIFPLLVSSAPPDSLALVPPALPEQKLEWKSNPKSRTADWVGIQDMGEPGGEMGGALESSGESAESWVPDILDTRHGAF